MILELGSSSVDGETELILDSAKMGQILLWAESGQISGSIADVNFYSICFARPKSCFSRLGLVQIRCNLKFGTVPLFDCILLRMNVVSDPETSHMGGLLILHTHIDFSREMCLTCNRSHNAAELVPIPLSSFRQRSHHRPSVRAFIQLEISENWPWYNSW